MRCMIPRSQPLAISLAMAFDLAFISARSVGPGMFGGHGVECFGAKLVCSALAFL